MPDVFDTFQKFEAEPTQEPTGDPTEPIAEPTAQVTEPTGAEPTTEPTQTPSPDGTPPATEPPKADEFFQTFNTKFNTQFKDESELKALFELPKKVSEYETKYKDYDTLKQSVDKYKLDLENLSQSEAKKYLDDPIMQKAWVVKELKAKYPNSDVSVLTNLAMSDLDKMSDIEVLANEVKMKLPNRSLESIKSVILDDIGADTSEDPKEWDEKILTKLEIKASAARENIRTLLGGVQLPKIESKEEAQARAVSELSKRVEQSVPQKQSFLQFDKFKVRDDLEYTVPDEFKSKLPDMFDEFIIKAGNDPTPENLQTLNDLREAFFFSENKDKILDMMYKDAESKVKAKLDEKLANSTPPNTATASDAAQGDKPTNDGTEFMKYLSGQGRATRI